MINDDCFLFYMFVATIKMIELDAAARPGCVIGALVWASILDKSACSNWVGLFELGGTYWHQLKLKTENETKQT